MTWPLLSVAAVLAAVLVLRLYRRHYARGKLAELRAEIEAEEAPAEGPRAPEPLPSRAVRRQHAAKVQAGLKAPDERQFWRRQRKGMSFTAGVDGGFARKRHIEIGRKLLQGPPKK